MNPKPHEHPAAEDARLRAALQKNAALLDAAPAEHRPWLEKVVAATCLAGVDSHQTRMANDLLGQVRVRGLARGVVGFLVGTTPRTRGRGWWAALRQFVPAFDKPAVFALVRQVLADPEPEQRVLAVSVIVEEAPTQEEAIALLTACLGDAAQEVRWRVALELSQRAPRTPGVAEELARCLGVEQPDTSEVSDWPPDHVVRMVANALGEMGAAAGAALPALRARVARGPGTSEETLALWLAVCEAVERITGSADERTTGLLGSIPAVLSGDIPGEPGRRLLREVARLGVGCAEAIPLFADALRYPHLAWAASEALCAAGPAGLPVLAQALACEEPHCRRMVAAALGKLGARAGAAVPALVGALNDPAKEARQAVRDALASIHSYLLVTRHLGRSEEEAFLESILESLGDDASCLIYADWLEEYGNEAGRVCAGIARERLRRRTEG